MILESLNLGEEYIKMIGMINILIMNSYEYGMCKSLIISHWTDEE